MNNQRSMLTSLITIGAASAAAYGVAKGIQNGTFQRLPQTLSNVMNNAKVQQISEVVQNAANGNRNKSEPSAPRTQETTPQQQMQHLTQTL